MDLILQEITPQLISVLAVFVSALSVYLTAKLKLFFDSKIDKENQEKLIKYVEASVNYVEQITKNLDGFDPEKKFDIAQSKVILWANEKGIPVTEDELEVLIEAIVYGSRK